ncbi:MAG: ATP-binding cassette domain-containing protein [Actinomycetota bacterium]
MTDSCMICATDLVKKFGEHTAVDGVSFDVYPGEIFGFLGPNGAGKTTTINMLCTLLKPTSGTATLNGFDIVKQHTDVRKSIGLVFQDPSLDSRLSAGENLKFHAMIYGLPTEVFKPRMAEVLDMVDLKDRVNDIVNTFSGGMKRRLEIARGLLHYPKMLFLDEPTLGLDPQTRNHIWEYIHTMKDREKMTIFLTTHYMEEAEHCDRIAIIDNGKIVAVDTPDGLKSMVGGDSVTIQTEDNAKAAEFIGSNYRLEVVGDKNGLHFEVEGGAEFVPRLAKEINVPLKTITVNRPTLEDVFLKLTGKAIRDEGADAMAEMRAAGRMWSRPKR